MIKYASGGKDSFQGKKVTISGSGNVAQYAALKVIELGGTVVSLSDSKGSMIATEGKGITPEMISTIADLKVKRKALADIASESDFSSVKYVEGARPWTHVGNVDVALPSATQNEVSEEEAEALVKAGCKFIAEGSNMGCTQEAIEVFEKARKGGKGAESIWYAPGKAANAGGVAVSGLEMAQNSARIKWTREEVDAKLKDIMKNCFENCLNTAKEYVTPKEGEFPSLVAGANIAGAIKVSYTNLFPSESIANCVRDIRSDERSRRRLVVVVVCLDVVDSRICSHAAKAGMRAIKPYFLFDGSLPIARNQDVLGKVRQYSSVSECL